MKKIIAAVIGLGFGASHAKAALQYGAELKYVCDTNEERLKARADELGLSDAQRITDWKVILDDPAINTVIVATPDQTHREICVALLDAGKNVMCEKPLALTREDMQAIAAAAKRATGKCMVGQICRFTPAFRQAKELIESGTIGELYYVESEYAHDYQKMLSNVNKHWRTDPLRHGVVGGGCHAVDLLRWIAGDPIEVFAYGTHKMLPMVSYDDATVAVMKFPNEIMGKVFVSTGCKRNYTMRSLFYGTKGTIICDNTSDHMQLFTVGEDGISVKEEPEIIPVDINNHNALHEFAVFAGHILEDTPVAMSAIEGAKTVEVCLSIVESSTLEKPVRLQYQF